MGQESMVDWDSVERHEGSVLLSSMVHTIFILIQPLE